MDNAETPLYARFLPPVLWEDEDERGLLWSYLLVLEQVLHGKPQNTDNKQTQGSTKGFQETLDSIADLYSPYLMPRLISGLCGGDAGEFLRWLAGWFSLAFGKEATSPGQKKTDPLYRRFLLEIVPLYRLRGTKEYLEKAIRIFHKVMKCEEYDVEVQENPGVFFVGKVRLGKDSRLGYTNNQIRCIIKVPMKAETFRENMISGNLPNYEQLPGYNVQSDGGHDMFVLAINQKWVIHQKQKLWYIDRSQSQIFTAKLPEGYHETLQNLINAEKPALCKHDKIQYDKK